MVSSMGSGLSTGLFTLAGTLFGGGVTFAVNWVTVRGQRKLAANARTQAVLDRRYASHMDFLMAVDRFRELARALRGLLYSEASTELADAAYAQCWESWKALVDKSGVAGVAGPPDLGRCVRTLSAAMAAYFEVVETWYQTDVALGERGVRDRQCAVELGKVDAARDLYIELAYVTLSE